MAEPQYSQLNALSPQNIASASDLSGLADTVSQTRSFWPTLLSRYQDRQYIENGMIADLVDNAGFVGVPMGTANVFHAEQDSVLSTSTVVSVANGLTPGAQATITIQVVTVDGAYFNYANVGQRFQVANNPGVTFTVDSTSFDESSTVHTITVTPPPTVTLATSVSAGDTLLPIDAVQAEGSDFPNGAVRGWARFGVNFQYMMTSSALMGPSAYSQNFEFTLADGRTILAPKNFADAVLTAYLRKSAAITIGKGVTYGGKSTTTGLVTAAQTFGLTADYLAGGVQMDDFQNIFYKLQNRGAGSKLKVYGGYAFLQSFQKNAVSGLSNGAIQYISGELNQKDEATSLRQKFGKFNIGGFEVTLTEATEWRHKEMYTPDLGGDSLATGYWANSFVVMPDEQVAVARELTQTSFTVTAPMFRVLQLQAPVEPGAAVTSSRVYARGGVNFGKENYQITHVEQFAAQTMMANKLYFGGTL